MVISQETQTSIQNIKVSSDTILEANLTYGMAVSVSNFKNRMDKLAKIDEIVEERKDGVQVDMDFDRDLQIYS